jgi:amylosucrase
MEGRIFEGLKKLIEIRKKTAAFAVGETRVIDLSTPHVFGFRREAGGQRVLALFNFTEGEQRLEANELRLQGLTAKVVDLVSGEHLPANAALTLSPYRFVWLHSP